MEKGIGKRKRTASRAIKSPFVVVKPIKRAKRSAKASKIVINQYCFRRTKFIVELRLLILICDL